MLEQHGYRGVTVPFAGTSVRWISGLDKNHDIADVHLDGAKVATVDTYGASTSSQTVSYSASGLSPGDHELEIVNTGAKNATATGGNGKAVYPVVLQHPRTALTFAGRDPTMLEAEYQLGASRLQHSTSEIMSSAQVNGSDVAVRYGRQGQAGETVLGYAAAGSRPRCGSSRARSTARTTTSGGDPVERDAGVGEQAAGDGKPITTRARRTSRGSAPTPRAT